MRMCDFLSLGEFWEKLGHALHSLQCFPVKMPMCTILYFIIVGLGILLY